MILNKIILDDLKDISNSNIEWQQLKNKTILITGASGMIASYLVYTLLYLNDTKSLNIKVIGLVRNIEKAKKHFKNILKREDFHIIKHDVRNEFYQDINIDYIIHAASQTDPHSFMFNPVETLETNVLGTNNFLKLAVKNKAKFLLLSTREIYGQPKDNARYVTENEYGILNHTLVRSCYPEGKKIAETMVISYRKEYNVDAKIVRIAHTYGPGIILGDGRVLGDFLNNYLKDTIDKGTWLINYYSKKLDLTKLNDKKKLINIIINEAIKNSNLYDVDFYFTKLSKLTGFDKSVFYSHYSQLVNAKNKNQSANKVKTEIPYVNVKEHDNKYLLLQRKIIYYMLENTDAIRLFKEKNVFLKNTDLRQIAKELCNFFDSNLDLKKIDVNLFLNYIDLNDSIADKKEKKSMISDIAFNKKMLMAPYTKEEFLITCDSLALESAKLRQKQEFDEISKSLSDKDKAIIAKDFINKTKESLK